MIITIASLVVAVVAVVLSAAFAHRQVGEMRRANSITLAMNIFEEFRSATFKAHSATVLKRLDTNTIAPHLGLSKLPEPIRSDAYRISHFYDTLGALVAHKLVDEELIFAFMGEAIDGAWSALRPYIQGEAWLRGTEYQVYFRDLARRSHDHPASIVRKQFILRPPP